MAVQISPAILGSELYALARGRKCEGKDQCHWCAAPCGRMWMHDDAPPIPFIKTNYSAKRPNNCWVCEGCRMWRAPSITVQFMHGGFKDRRSCMLHSWWVTESNAVAVTLLSKDLLYPKLLAPPNRFMLALLANNICSGSLDDKVIRNNLHQCVINDLAEIQADTPLQFTVNNVLHTYTVYELEEALRNGIEGKAGGVRELVSMFGPYTLPPKVPENRGKGRPHEPLEDGKVTKKKIKGED